MSEIAARKYSELAAEVRGAEDDKQNLLLDDSEGEIEIFLFYITNKIIKINLVNLTGFVATVKLLWYLFQCFYDFL